jgi:glycosyltransferase involved in cell wall biosynthesis
VPVVIAMFPLISRGGVFSFWQGVLPQLRAREIAVSGIVGGRADLSGLDMPIVDPAWRLSISSFLRVRRTLRRCATAHDVVVVSSLPQVDIVMATLGRRARRSWLMYVHGQPFPSVGEAGLVRRLLWEWSWRCARARCLHRYYVSGELRDRLDPGAGVLTVGVPDPAGQHLANRAQGHLVGYVGRLSVEKGADRLPGIAQAIARRLVVRGTGPLRMRLSQMAGAGLALEGWVQRPGCYHDLSCLVMPSRREGIPLVLLEAQMLGIPVVGADVGGIREGMAESSLDAGLLVGRASADDPQAWGSAIARAELMSAEDRSQLRDQTMAEFGMDAFVSRFQEAIEECRDAS